MAGGKGWVGLEFPGWGRGWGGHGTNCVAQSVGRCLCVSVSLCLCISVSLYACVSVCLPARLPVCICVSLVAYFHELIGCAHTERPPPRLGILGTEGQDEPKIFKHLLKTTFKSTTIGSWGPPGPSWRRKGPKSFSRTPNLTCVRPGGAHLRLQFGRVLGWC